MTGAEIVDLKGKPIADGEETRDVVVALRRFLERIEAGEIVVEEWIFLAQLEHKEKGYVTPFSVDSGLTVAQYVFTLEAEKLRTMATANVIAKGIIYMSPFAHD